MYKILSLPRKSDPRWIAGSFFSVLVVTAIESTLKGGKMN